MWVRIVTCTGIGGVTSFGKALMGGWGMRLRRSCVGRGLMGFMRRLWMLRLAPCARCLGWVDIICCLLGRDRGSCSRWISLKLNILRGCGVGLRVTLVIAKLPGR